MFVAVYDDATGEFLNHNWRVARDPNCPQLPATLTAATVNAKNAGGYQVFTLLDIPSTDVPGRRGPHDGRPARSKA